MFSRHYPIVRLTLWYYQVSTRCADLPTVLINVYTLQRSYSVSSRQTDHLLRHPIAVIRLVQEY